MRTVAVTIHGQTGEADADARQLRTELLQLDVDRVDLAAGADAPDGAKGVDTGTVSTLVVALAGSPVLVQLVGVLQDWVGRARHRTITVVDGDRKLQLTGGSTADSTRAIEEFFRAG
jgi:Ca2+-binding RTX toxin-like protein